MRLLSLIALLILSVPSAFAAQDPARDDFWYGRAADGGPRIHLYYFYSPTCPHCQAAAPFLEELQGRLPWLELRKYSVQDDRDNARFYYNTAQSLGVEALSVPGFIFCRQVMIGFDTAATTGAELEQALTSCRERRTSGEPAADVAASPAQGSPVDAGSVVHCRWSAAWTRAACPCRC